MEDLFYNYYGKSFCTAAPKVKLETQIVLSVQKKETLAVQWNPA